MTIGWCFDNTYSKLPDPFKEEISPIPVKNPELIKTASAVYGSQCIVSSIDVKKNSLGKYKVMIDRGRIETTFDPINWAIEVEKRGAGEIILCNIDRDGTQKGLDIKITKEITKMTKIAIILS